MAQVARSLAPTSQLPTNASRKAGEGDPRGWALATCFGDLDGVPSSWSQSGPTLAVAGIWRVRE